MLFEISISNTFWICLLRQGQKSKNKQMTLHQTKKSFAQRRKASIKRKNYEMGENICKRWNKHPKYIRTHTIQYQKTNYLILKTVFFQRRHTDIKEAHGKKLNISNYQPQWYHLTSVRMVIIKKNTNNKCWWRRREKGSLLHC